MNDIETFLSEERRTVVSELLQKGDYIDSITAHDQRLLAKVFWIGYDAGVDKQIDQKYLTNEEKSSLLPLQENE